MVIGGVFLNSVFLNAVFLGCAGLLKNSSALKKIDNHDLYAPGSGSDADGCSDTVGLQPGATDALSPALSPFPGEKVAFSMVSEADADQFTLHPLEEEALGEAVSPKRRRDFSVGRLAAREALKSAGFPMPSPVLRGEHREPLWPVGVVGSISHSGGFGVAAVAWQKDVAAVGVDIQQIEDRYRDELIARFADPDEFDWVRSDPARRTERAVKLFSAKESVFKALYPIGKVWFAFDAASLTPTPDELGFTAEVRLPALSNGVIHLDIGVSVHQGHVVTGAWLRKPLPVAAIS